MTLSTMDVMKKKLKKMSGNIVSVQKDKEYPLIRTNEHPGRINIVYKELMKMEREKTRKNKQER